MTLKSKSYKWYFIYGIPLHQQVLSFMYTTMFVCIDRLLTHALIIIYHPIFNTANIWSMMPNIATTTTIWLANIILHKSYWINYSHRFLED